MKISDFCLLNSTSLKKNESSKEFLYLDTANITNGTIDSFQEYSSYAELPSRARRKVTNNSILYSTVRPNQKHFGILTNPPDNLIVSTGFCVIDVDEKIANPRYVYYYLAQESITTKLHAIAEQATTAYPSIKTKDLGDLDINLPDLEKQNEIAKILTTLDEKIFLNSRINDNLEQQILSLYEHLFVTQKEDDWKEGALGDIGTIVGGGTPSKSRTEYYAENGIAWITPKDLSINKSKYIYRGGVDISDLGFKKSSACLVPAGTVLFSSRAPIGYIAIAGQELTTNQGFKSVIPSKTIGTSFIYCFLKKNLPLIESMSSGSTFKEISGSSMKQVPVTIPNNRSLDLFNQYVNPLFDKQKILEKENRTLAEIRDTMLLKFFG